MAPQPGRHRNTRQRPGARKAERRPRYGRISILGASVAVTLIAVIGAFGLLPSGGSDAAASVAGPSSGGSSPSAESARERPSVTSSPLGDEVTKPLAVTAVTDRSLPARSGTGRRVVFSESRQHVWMIDGDGEIVRHYPVSGSIYDNLEPGTYDVFSRSRHAVGIDDSGTMEYFVRFTYGTGGSAIGFHSIPVDDGKPVQTIAQLGTPLSHGCIRQKRADAIAMWEFADEGTKVVVTA